MISWDCFIYFGIVSIILYVAGTMFAAFVPKSKHLAIIATTSATVVLGIFIVILWLSLDRPPLKTSGETRLWYSFFAYIAGIIVYVRWKYKWILGFTAILSAVFIIINIVKPEIHDQTLMPALESIYFIPHVTVYMLSYSLLGCICLISVIGMVKRESSYLTTCDELVYIGLSLLLIGMVLGSIWAKQAWGSYWNWDPKETWAAITLMGYLIYLHLRLQRFSNVKVLFAILIISFVALQMCWYGIDLLPSAQNSIHVYK